MLTKHCYENIKSDWDSSDDKAKVKIIDCCKKTDPEDPTCTDCCYDNWKDQLKTVSQSYKEATEKADQLKKKLTFITDRRDRYRTWAAELNKLEDKARAICLQLGVIANQSDRLWYSSCKAVEAIEILFCMIRDFYVQVDCLKKRYDDLQTCITNNHDPSLVKGQGILKYLDEYSQKLDAVIKTRDDLIVGILEAIKIASLIRSNISTKCCPSPDDKTNPYNPCNPTDELCPDCDEKTGKNRYYGVKTVICEWYKEFNCKTDCTPPDPCKDCDEKNKQSQDQDQQNQPPILVTDETADDKKNCCLTPYFNFPICNDNYKKLVDQWVKYDEDQVTKLGATLMEENKKKESLQACKDSLTKAIDQVDPKERCK